MIYYSYFIRWKRNHKESWIFLGWVSLFEEIITNHNEVLISCSIKDFAIRYLVKRRNDRCNYSGPRTDHLIEQKPSPIAVRCMKGKPVFIGKINEGFITFVCCVGIIWMTNLRIFLADHFFNIFKIFHR